MRRRCLGDDSLPSVVFFLTLLNIHFSLSFPSDVPRLLFWLYCTLALTDPLPILIFLLLRLVHILCDSTICTKPARLAVPLLLEDPGP